ncbi:MAG: Gfo/Idh/MocA family oxidoreductase [Bacteroidales bacterium]|nr:Gfo/Idh/MocA family oxidoreductase [Bacteroidales bacterium]
MEKIIHFAIIGCGRIAQRHAEHISKIGVLTAVCDIDVNKAKELGEKYKANYYSSIEELLNSEKQTDVISICSPNGLHAEHTIQSLRAGYHVLCEKPMAINVHDCGAMIQEAEKANKRLFIVKQNRFNPPISALKSIIQDGKLGKIFNVQLNCFWNRNDLYYSESDWKGSLKLDGGTLYTQFSHFVDLLFWMIGDVKDVHAYANNFIHNNIIEFEDTGVVVLRFYNGALGTINFTINAHSKNMEGSLTVFAEKGTLKIGGQYLNVIEYQDIDGFKIENLSEGNPPNFYGQYVGSMSNHNIVYENVVDVLNNHGIIATNGFEGLKTVEIIDKIYSSIKRNN